MNTRKDNCRDSCVIATAADYVMSRKMAIQRYEKMSIKDFEQQFETKDALKFDRSELTVFKDGRFKRIVRSVAPFTTFKTWKGADAKGSCMVSAIYTEPDGFPVAEYCAVRNRNAGAINIAGDLDAFYDKYGWKAYQFEEPALLPPFKKKNLYPADVELAVLSVILDRMK